MKEAFDVYYMHRYIEPALHSATAKVSDENRMKKELHQHPGSSRL